MENAIFWGIIIVLALIALIYYSRTKKPVRNALAGMASGAAALTAINLFGGYIGINLGFSVFNAAISLILGIPGVIALVLLKIFI